MPDIDFEKELKRQKLQEELKNYKREMRNEELKESMETLVTSLASGVASVAKISASALENAMESMEKKDKSNRISEAEMVKRRLELRKKQTELKTIKKEKRKRKSSWVFSPLFLAGFIFIWIASGFDRDWMGIFAAYLFFQGSKKFIGLFEPNKVFRGMPLFGSFLLFLGFANGFFGEWFAFAGAFLAYYGAKAFMNRDDLPKLKERKKPSISMGEKRNKKLEENTEFIEMMTISNKHLDIIYKCFEKSNDRDIKEYSLKLYERGIEILNYIKENPDKLMSARRFLTYYLETASNICEKYMSLPVKTLKSEDMEEMVKNTKKAMLLLETAFDKEYEKLIQDDILDVETDIKVLENSMKWDNYMN